MEHLINQKSIFQEKILSRMKNQRHDRSYSKQNYLSYSYNDLTSPIHNLQKSKQNKILKKSIHNNFSAKVSLYKGMQKRQQTKYECLKASAALYKVPQFSSPQVNYQISQSVRLKVQQIKNEMITHLPQISKSSNYNPRKLQNIFNHRSNIIQLQSWLKNKLKQPPINMEQSVQYKNMIMAVGMKDLIRIVNKRCHEEGKMIQEIWELTWSICREIILYLSNRARKCEQILENQIIEFNRGFKQNFSSLELQLLQARKKLQDNKKYQDEQKQRIVFLTQQNEQLISDNSRHKVDNLTINQQFFNVLQQNLSLYLHVGDKSKRDWIKKMYSQVNRAQLSFKNNLKLKVNKTIEERIKTQKVYQDNAGQQLEIDQNGNFVVEQLPQGYIDQQQNTLKLNMMEQFKVIDFSTQTNQLELLQQQVQCLVAQLVDKETQIQFEIQQIGINTDGLVKQQTKQAIQIKSKAKKMQQQKQKKINLSSKTNKKVVNTKQTKQIQEQKSNYHEKQEKVQIISYVCAQCLKVKSQADAKLQLAMYERQKLRILEAKRTAKRDNNQIDNSNNEQLNNSYSFQQNDDQQHQLQKENNQIKHRSQSISINDNDGILSPKRPSFDLSPQQLQKLQKQKKKQRNPRKRDSSMIHDINFKKQLENILQKKEQGVGTVQDEQDLPQHRMKLSLHNKQSYSKFFTQQITEANRDFISDINLQQLSTDNILNNYFNLVQQINAIPQNKIVMSEKQMFNSIQKNLMPIIMQLLGQVKKSIQKKTIQVTLRTFYSLPYVIMNKFSTKYGVKIIAIKNIKLLLSSLKKVQSYTDKYKSLRLMMFTDCRAYYSQDLFTYLYVIATIAPYNTQRDIGFDQVAQVREICQQYLTKDRKIYQDFQQLTQQDFSTNQKTHGRICNLKVPQLLRSIISSYRMVKINRIQQVGFVFLMLKKQNYVEYKVFSFFMSFIRISTELKVKIVKEFLENCDLKTKQKKIAISQSGFSRFLIKCPQFNLELLVQTISKQKSQFNPQGAMMTMKSFKSKRPQRLMGTQQQLQIGVQKKQEKVSLKVLQSTKKMQALSSQKQILQSMMELKPASKLQVPQAQNQVLQQVASLRHLKHDSSQVSFHLFNQQSKIREYSYFTYSIVKFLENQEYTKFINIIQKQFVYNYLEVHVVNCEVDDLVGIVDYFSNDMLEIICFNTHQLTIAQTDHNINSN